MKSSDIQPIKLCSIGHVTPKQKDGEAQVSSGQSMVQDRSNRASVSVFTLYLPFVFIKFSNRYRTCCILTESIEQYLQGTFNVLAFIKSVQANS